MSDVKHVLGKDELSPEDVVSLLKIDDSRDLQLLLTHADRVRSEFIGEEVHVRGILEFSNNCVNDCKYCGIRRSNANIERYRIREDEIVGIASWAVNRLGFRTVLLQSGEDSFYTDDVIESLVQDILDECDCRVALSIGERSRAAYQRFFDAGASRVLVRFETSDARLYESLHSENNCSKNSLAERVKLLKYLKSVGYQVGTGMMIGLPGQTVESLADDIILYNKLNINMAGMGPFIPHPGTPLGGTAGGSFTECIKAIAVTRIICKDIFISATTALQTINPLNGRQAALRAGANLLMPNITPRKYRRHYQLYPGKVCIFEDPSDCAGCMRGVVQGVGRVLGDGYGDTVRR